MGRDLLNLRFQEALEAHAKAAAGNDIADFEPAAIAFLNAAQSAPDHVVALVTEAVEPVLGDVGSDFHEYVFYYLRWPEFRLYVDDLRVIWENDIRRTTVWSYLDEAFSDEWEGRDFFKGPFPSG